MKAQNHYIVLVLKQKQKQEQIELRLPRRLGIQQYNIKNKLPEYIEIPCR